MNGITAPPLRIAALTGWLVEPCRSGFSHHGHSLGLGEKENPYQLMGYCRELAASVPAEAGAQR